MKDRDAVGKCGRILISFILFFWVAFALRAAQLQILDHQKFTEYADSQQRSTMPLSAKRGTIYDCQGRMLAYDIEANSYTVNPKYMKKPSEAAAKLAAITGMPKAHWMQQFTKHPGFLMVARRVDSELKQKLDNSGIETLRAREETMRVYPYKDLAAEIVGRVDSDNKGLSGLEKYYDDLLAGNDGQSIYLRDAYGREITNWEHTLVSPVNGSDLYLAMDINMQEILEVEMEQQLDSSGAKWGAAIFIDLESGGVLACGTIEKNKLQFKRCRAVVDENEPGSTAKIIPLAAVFQAGIFEPTDIINVEGGRFMVSGRTVRDDHPKSLLTCSEIGVYSSNIGAAKLGLTAGPELIYKTLVQFGFGARTGIDFPGETPGTLRAPDTWTNHQLAIICFGYGVTASALQLACAYGIVATGGDLLKPYFAAKAVSPDSTEKQLNARTVVRQALDDRTVTILDDVFKNVVEIGTATRAIDELCWIAGKTGTALRITEGRKGYEKGKALASFAGYFPADNPRIVGVVMFDQPRTSVYGGEVSAPVFKNIAKRYSGLPGNDILVNSKPRPREKKVNTLAKGGEAKMAQASVKREIESSKAGKKTPVTDGFHDFTGQTMRDAIRKARDMGLIPKISGAGVVVAQNPAPGVDTTGVVTVELIGETE